MIVAYIFDRRKLEKTLMLQYTGFEVLIGQSLYKMSLMRITACMHVSAGGGGRRITLPTGLQGPGGIKTKFTPVAYILKLAYDTCKSYLSHLSCIKNLLLELAVVSAARAIFS